jgi:hypothetical protein
MATRSILIPEPCFMETVQILSGAPRADLI